MSIVSSSLGQNLMKTNLLWGYHFGPRFKMTGKRKMRLHMARIFTMENEAKHRKAQRKNVGECEVVSSGGATPQKHEPHIESISSYALEEPIQAGLFSAIDGCIEAGAAAPSIAVEKQKEIGLTENVTEEIRGNVSKTIENVIKSYALGCDEAVGRSDVSSDELGSPITKNEMKKVILCIGGNRHKTDYHGHSHKKEKLKIKHTDKKSKKTKKHKDKKHEIVENLTEKTKNKKKSHKIKKEKKKKVKLNSECYVTLFDVIKLCSKVKSDGKLSVPIKELSILDHEKRKKMVQKLKERKRLNKAAKVITNTVNDCPSDMKFELKEEKTDEGYKRTAQKENDDSDVRTKEEDLSNCLKIEEIDIDEEIKMLNENQYQSIEDMQVPSDIHTEDPLTSNSLNSQKSTETAKNVVLSTSTVLSSRIERSVKMDMLKDILVVAPCLQEGEEVVHQMMVVEATFLDHPCLLTDKIKNTLERMQQYLQLLQKHSNHPLYGEVDCISNLDIPVSLMNPSDTIKCVWGNNQALTRREAYDLAASKFYLLVDLMKTENEIRLLTPSFSMELVIRRAVFCLGEFLCHLKEKAMYKTDTKTWEALANVCSYSKHFNLTRFYEDLNTVFNGGVWLLIHFKIQKLKMQDIVIRIDEAVITNPNKQIRGSIQVTPKGKDMSVRQGFFESTPAKIQFPTINAEKDPSEDTVEFEEAHKTFNGWRLHLGQISKGRLKRELTYEESKLFGERMIMISDAYKKAKKSEVERLERCPACLQKRANCYILMTHIRGFSCIKEAKLPGKADEIDALMISDPSRRCSGLVNMETLREDEEIDLDPINEDKGEDADERNGEEVVVTLLNQKQGTRDEEGVPLGMKQGTEKDNVSQSTLNISGLPEPEETEAAEELSVVGGPKAAPQDLTDDGGPTPQDLEMSYSTDPSIQSDCVIENSSSSQGVAPMSSEQVWDPAMLQSNELTVTGDEINVLIMQNKQACMKEQIEKAILMRVNALDRAKEGDSHSIKILIKHTVEELEKDIKKHLKTYQDRIESIYASAREQYLSNNTVAIKRANREELREESLKYLFAGQIPNGKLTSPTMTSDIQQRMMTSEPQKMNTSEPQKTSKNETAESDEDMSLHVSSESNLDDFKGQEDDQHEEGEYAPQPHPQKQLSVPGSYRKQDGNDDEDQEILTLSSSDENDLASTISKEDEERMEVLVEEDKLKVRSFITSSRTSISSIHMYLKNGIIRLILKNKSVLIIRGTKPYRCSIWRNTDIGENGWRVECCQSTFASPQKAELHFLACRLPHKIV